MGYLQQQSFYTCFIATYVLTRLGQKCNMFLPALFEMPAVVFSRFMKTKSILINILILIINSKNLPFVVSNVEQPTVILLPDGIKCRVECRVLLFMSDFGAKRQICR